MTITSTPKNPTFTITYKNIMEIVEHTYTTRNWATVEALEEELRIEGSLGHISYFHYYQGRKGEVRRMAFL